MDIYALSGEKQNKITTKIEYFSTTYITAVHEAHSFTHRQPHNLLTFKERDNKQNMVQTSHNKSRFFRPERVYLGNIYLEHNETRKKS